MSSIFPVIIHIDQLREKVSHHPEIRFMTHPNGLITACYMIGNSELWSGENAAWVAECRGITFDKKGYICCRPLHKFFNVGERPNTQRNVINLDKTVRLMDKRDGCCDENGKVLTVEGEKTFKEICETKYMGPIVGYDIENNCQIVSYIIDHSILDNNNDWYEIELENGSKRKLTGNHLVWVSNRKSYIPVRELSENDEVILSEEDY